MFRSKEAQPSSPCTASVCKEKVIWKHLYIILMQENKTLHSFKISFRNNLVLVENVLKQKHSYFLRAMNTLPLNFYPHLLAFT